MLNQIELSVLDKRFTNISYGASHYRELNLPRELIVPASRYKSLTVKEEGITFNFNQIEQDKQQPHLFKVGETKEHQVVYFNRETHLLSFNGIEKDLDAVLGFDSVDKPVDYTEVKVLGERFPIGLILARQHGISELCHLLNIHPVKLERNQRIKLEPHQWSLTFADEVWIFDRRDRIGSIILGGLKPYERHLKQTPAFEFEEKDVYGNILSTEGYGIRYEYEFDLMEEMFVDHISKQILEENQQPTEFGLLLVAASELLLRGDTKDEINMEDMLIKGYENISGQIYTHIVRAARANKLKPLSAKKRFELNPNEIWLDIQRDSAMEIVDEINPVKNLKEKANVTFGGNGGRSRRSMVKHTRAYHQTDMGVISEASVDNADVGVTTFLSANPNFKDLYGGTSVKDLSELSPTNIYSAAALLCPCSENDDQQ